MEPTKKEVDALMDALRESCVLAKDAADDFTENEARWVAAFRESNV